MSDPVPPESRDVKSDPIDGAGRLTMDDLNRILEPLETDLEEFEIPSRLQWDLQLGLPLLHVSFVLEHFIPRRHIQGGLSYWNSTRHEDVVKAMFHDTPDITPELAGSTSEGFRQPTYFPRKMVRFHDEAKLTVSDNDVVIVLNDKVVEFPGNESSSVRFLAETKDCYPGYCRLRLKNPELTGVEFKSKIPGTDNYYLTSAAIVGNITKQLNRNADKVNLYLTSQRHGPALTVEYDQHLKQTAVDSDFVLALPCSSWPKEGRMWLERTTRSGWPSPEVKANIARDACLVVGASHTFSSQPDIEWRISFTRLERQLARSLSDVHRQCYVLLKVLIKHTLAPLKIITSYHIKTLLFWTVEKVPWQLWDTATQEGLAAGFLCVLDELLKCLACSNLPHYIFTDNNLFAPIHRDFMDDIRRKVFWLRQNLVQAVIEFDKTYVFFFTSLNFPLGPILEPLLKDAQSVYHDAQRAYNVYCTPLLLLANAHARSGNPDETINTFRELSHILKLVFNRSTSFVAMTLELAQSVDPLLGCALYERLLQRFPHHSDASNMRCNLACLYHIRAHAANCSISDKRKLLIKTKKQFELGVNSPEASGAGFVDYAVYLYREGHYEEALDMSRKVLGMDVNSSVNNFYSESASVTLDEQLQADIGLDGPLVVPTKALAMYIASQCLLLTNQIPAASVMCSRLADQCDRHWKIRQAGASAAWRLLGYACMTRKRYEKAREVFTTANELTDEMSEACQQAILTCDAVKMSLESSSTSGAL